MSQHDYVIAGGTGIGGLAVRQDINTALLAIASNNSGATEPATMYAHQLWADTTTNTLKLRNAANTAWLLVCDLLTGAPVLGAGAVLVFEGTTDNAFETTVTVVDPTADRTVTLPDATTTLAGLAVTQTFTAPQRGTPTTDNDLSFDQSVANHFTCTPTAGGTLTFTNHTAGQSGFIKFVNNSNYVITAAATTKCDSGFLSSISITGTYLISYYDDGTNAYCVASRALV